jgi:ribonuclease VapC
VSDIVIDTSAVVAILGGEPDADVLIDAIEAADARYLSAATLVEVGIVLEARHGPAGTLAVDRFLRDGEVEVVALDRTQAERALDGWRRFGKGRHPAALNLGDCSTYGLAAELGMPVLCTGDDFAQTDLVVLPER